MEKNIRPVYHVTAKNKAGETHTFAPIVTKELGFDYVIEELRNTVGYHEGDVIISARLINDGMTYHDSDAIGRFFSIKALAEAGTRILDNAVNAGSPSIATLYSALEQCDQIKSIVEDLSSLVWAMIEEEEIGDDKEEKEVAKGEKP